MNHAARLIPVLFTALLAACANQAAGGFPTPLPTEFLPTSIALTVAAGLPAATPSTAPTRTGTATATPTASATLTPTPTFTPSVTPTPTDTPIPLIPLADIEIRTPGQLSKVISPIPVRAVLIPGQGGNVTIELLGEDGRLLARQITPLNENLGRKAGLILDLPFEIPGEAELGRLQISTLDRFGRPQALSSVDLILLSSGAADLNIPTDFLTRLTIEEPPPNGLIQGGTLIVTGHARPVTGQPFLAELIAEDGRVIGMRLFEPANGPANAFRPFLVEIPYSVGEPTRVRLVIRERSERIPGTVFLTSLEIIVSP